MPKLSEQVNHKFIDSINIDDCDTDTIVKKTGEIKSITVGELYEQERN